MIQVPEGTNDDVDEQVEGSGHSTAVAHVSAGLGTQDVKRIVEGVLLCAARPLSVNDVRQLLQPELEIGSDTVRSLLDDIRREWKGRAVELTTIASGWRFQSAPDVARFVTRLTPERTPRYSRAVMETLAIIAYRQPVTRGDIEEIRGVTVSSQIIKTLEDRGWIDQVGVKEVPGRPALFATTRQFLDDLGLRAITELPSLDSDSAPNADAMAPLFPETPDTGTADTSTAAEAAESSPPSIPTDDGVAPDPDQLLPGQQGPEA